MLEYQQKNAHARLLKQEQDKKKYLTTFKTEYKFLARSMLAYR